MSSPTPAAAAAAAAVEAAGHNKQANMTDTSAKWQQHTF
jgi:hypothetical protein